MSGVGVRARVEIFTLVNFKRLAENETNHADILKDPRILHYIERGLETCDDEVVKTSLSILELLADNPKNYETLKGMVGVRSSVQNLAERRFGIDTKLKRRAEKVSKCLEGNTKPLTKDKLSWPRKILVFHVYGLHAGTRKELEDILTKKVKGVLTVQTDVEHQRCILSVYSHIESKEIAEAIHESGFMQAYQVLRNSQKQEVLIPLVDEVPTPEPVSLPEYLEEDVDEVKGLAVKTKDLRVTASEWFLTTAGFIQRSMYW